MYPETFTVTYILRDIKIINYNFQICISFHLFTFCNVYFVKNAYSKILLRIRLKQNFWLRNFLSVHDDNISTQCPGYVGK